VTTHSFERRAANRNRKQAARAPLFAWAGLLEDWTPQQVAYDELARGIASYERAVNWDRQNVTQLATLVQMLDEAISAENREEVVADMMSRSYLAGYIVRQIDHLCAYLARYQKRLPLDVYNELVRRITHEAPGQGGQGQT
jgi:hypothetical protein